MEDFERKNGKKIYLEKSRRSQNKGFNVRALRIRRMGLVVGKEVVVVEREDGELYGGDNDSIIYME